MGDYMACVNLIPLPSIKGAIDLTAIWRGMRTDLANHNKGQFIREPSGTLPPGGCNLEANVGGSVVKLFDAETCLDALGIVVTSAANEQLLDMLDVAKAIAQRGSMITQTAVDTYVAAREKDAPQGSLRFTLLSQAYAMGIGQVLEILTFLSVESPAEWAQITPTAAFRVFEDKPKDQCPDGQVCLTEKELADKEAAARTAQASADATDKTNAVRQAHDEGVEEGKKQGGGKTEGWGWVLPTTIGGAALAAGIGIGAWAIWLRSGRNAPEGMVQARFIATQQRVVANVLGKDIKALSDAEVEIVWGMREEKLKTKGQVPAQAADKTAVIDLRAVQDKRTALQPGGALADPLTSEEATAITSKILEGLVLAMMWKQIEQDLASLPDKKKAKEATRALEWQLEVVDQRLKAAKRVSYNHSGPAALLDNDCVCYFMWNHKKDDWHFSIELQSNAKQNLDILRRNKENFDHNLLQAGRAATPREAAQLKAWESMIAQLEVVLLNR